MPVQPCLKPAGGYAFPDCRLLVFAKAPIAGQAKTRLIPLLGADGAADLQACLTRSLVARLCNAGLSPLDLWVTPDPTHPLFTQLQQTFSLRLKRQCDGDLGSRMLDACRQTRARAVVLLGTDCPELDPGHLAQALEQLKQADAAMIPALDGGYVLLAIKQAAPALFQRMPWGGPQVAEQTRQRMRQLGWRWHELPPLRDLDRPEDLAVLRPQVEAMNCDLAALRV